MPACVLLAADGSGHQWVCRQSCRPPRRRRRRDRLTRLTRSPAHGVARGKVQAEPLRLLPIEGQRRIHPPERVVRRNANGSPSGVGHRHTTPLPVGDERDLAVREPHASRTVRRWEAERLAQDHQPCALVQQHLDADLGHDVGDPVQDRGSRGGCPARAHHVVVAATGARCHVHLVAHQRDRFRGVQGQAARTRFAGELGQHEDLEPILLGGVQVHLPRAGEGLGDLFG